MDLETGDAINPDDITVVSGYGISTGGVPLKGDKKKCLQVTASADLVMMLNSLPVADQLLLQLAYST